ncbi:MAG: T9SS type A sorting domain-containing protein [Muribaculaceae bacterium]|nr:T9SS type A sorting domain-containing protein [Muribaculaceae bacterium]
MKHYNFKAMSLCLALALGLAALSADAATKAISTDSPLGRQLLTQHHNRQFRGEKLFTADRAMPAVKAPETAMAKGIEPAYTFTDLPQYDYLEGPDGTTWFYTAEYTIEAIVHNPYWTEELIKGFEFTIYDSSFMEVGKVKDVITLDKFETRAREVVVDPAVSAHFFNTDDNLEIMVFHAMNTEQYVNNYYYKVYSIGGEKDDDGNDISICKIEGRCVDATNASNTDEEDFYYTFVKDPVVNQLDATRFPTYVDYLNTLTYKLSTYSKATDTEGIKKIFEKDVYSTRIPGDTTDGIYLIVKKLNGELYYIYSQYDKPYFIDPVGGATNEAATPDNSLKIEAYQMTADEPTLLSTTLIPVEDPSTPEALVYAFYSIGSVGWANDVDMVVNGTPKAPAYLVAHDVAKAATLEDIASDYTIYANNGSLVKTIAENTESVAVFGTPQGEEPQAMFIRVDEDMHYFFDVINLYTGTILFTVDQSNDDDPLTATCDRMKTDNGYLYAYEMAQYDIDLEGNYFVRIAWLNEKGQLDHIDRINIGTDVQYASANIAAAVLNPYLYDDDDKMEYAVLVKRTTLGGTTRNEFVVVDDSGETYIKFTDDDQLGNPYMYTIVPGNPNRIMMVYNEVGRFNVVLYDLPFDNIGESGVKEITTAVANKISYDGNTITANNAAIELYNPAGTLVAKGNNTLSVKALNTGIYLVVATDATGAKTTTKVTVR